MLFQNERPEEKKLKLLNSIIFAGKTIKKKLRFWKRNNKIGKKKTKIKIFNTKVTKKLSKSSKMIICWKETTETKNNKFKI